MNNYFMETHHHEWILSNRKGSYALGTGNLINQRKYHGLLIASDSNFNRRHLIAGMEEKVEWRGEIIHLDSNNYSNCIYPEGFLYLVKPWLRPYPAFLYSALPHQNEILILKEIMMDEDSNTVLVRYRNLGHHRLHFHLHPKYTMTHHHQLNSPGSLDNEDFYTEINGGEDRPEGYCRRNSNQYEVFTYTQKGMIESNRYVYYNVYYPWEVMSGYEGIGDQISLFELSFELGIGESNCIVFSDVKIADPEKAIAKIINRYSDLPQPMDLPLLPDQDDTLLTNLDYADNKLFRPEAYQKILELALMDFIGNDDVVAGYPFYGAWGRDSMFVINALLHMDGNQDLAERILRKYNLYTKNGLIPNVFEESGREVNYDTIDASLWYVIMLWKLGKRKPELLPEMAGIVEKILLAILDNVNFPFRVKEDKLLELLPEFAHATWMDVRIDGRPVTPRNGAPVEINALWYNSICVYEDIAQRLNIRDFTASQERILQLKDPLKVSLKKFWNGSYLADRLLGDESINEIRPNAVIALSLPFDFLDKEKMKSVFNIAKAELYTPYGIRTLSPKDPKFRKKYYGPQRERDLACHNGSVWSWLLSPFCGLFVKINSEHLSDPELADKLEEIIGTFRTSFMKGHIASIAEIWDGDNPHFPKGAPALAMSVAALYNVESFITMLREPK